LLTHKENMCFATNVCFIYNFRKFMSVSPLILTVQATILRIIQHSEKFYRVD
jgi:hypothetical protein